MFRWEESTGFYLLLLIPAIALLWWWAQREIQRQRARMITSDLFDRLINYKIYEWMKPLLLGLILTFSAFAFVNPQSGLRKEKQKVEKSDIFVALDISNSMNARDISPSRLEKSKRFISDFFKSRYGDQVGLIYFAGSAFLQMPLTTDIAAAEMFVKSANTNMAGTQGTNIGEAIQLAMQSVQEPHQRALLLVSDGEDHDDKALNMAAKAKENGWVVFTVGVGTDAGALIPMIEDGREVYIYDDSGNPVNSVMNEKLMKDIASKGGGLYYQLTDETKSIITDLNQKLDKLQKHAREVQSYTEYISYYQYLLFPAIAFLVFGLFYDFKNNVA